MKECVLDGIAAISAEEERIEMQRLQLESKLIMYISDSKMDQIDFHKN